jgi:hypothetical protein
VVRSETPVFGRIPRGATHWSIRKRGDYAWEWCTFAGGDGVVQQEFGIGDLSVALIRKRWGEGTYRVMFVSHASGTRQVFGNGKVFELVGSHQTGTPKPTGRVTPAQAEAARPERTADHADMVRALLLAAEGKSGAKEIFEALAIPTGIGLSSLFAFQERASDRLEAIEKRLASLERRLGAPPAQTAPAAPLDRVLDKLEAIEERLSRAAAQPPRGQPIGAIRPVPARRRSSPIR